MRLATRVRQFQGNLAENGLGPTLYKVYFYLYGYAFDYGSGGLDTTSPATSDTLADDGRPKGDRTAAFPCHPRILRQSLQKLDITPADVFMDIGCGKGRALAVAAGFPFKRLVGVDLIGRHIEVTRSNLQRMGVFEAQLIEGNALTLPFPDDVSVCFLFKPFPEEVILDCIRRLNDSSLRAIIVMGSDLEAVEGYRVVRRYVHRPSTRFSYLLLERDPTVMR